MSGRFKILETPMAGLHLVERLRLGDERGFLTRLFCADELADLGFDGPVAQTNETGTDIAGTVRGMHYQLPPFAEIKMVTCVAGAVLDASSRFDAQNLQVDSRGWSVTGYGVYAPYAFLSFPVAVTIGRWSSDQTRDGTNLLPTYRASYNSPTFASSAGAALTLPASRFLVTTSLTHQYSSTRRPAYSEAINPLATDFVFTPAETTEASQLIGAIRLTLPFEAGRVWASAGYAHDLKRSPSESTRSEVPLAVGVDLVTARWLFGVSGQTILRNDITSYTGSVIGRLQF